MLSQGLISIMRPLLIYNPSFNGKIKYRYEFKCITNYGKISSSAAILSSSSAPAAWLMDSKVKSFLVFELLFSLITN
tara:strand:- start:312 stop:542 length:231 start_codon:yes stop_codon:yes gene_type:complete